MIKIINSFLFFVNDDRYLDYFLDNDLLNNLLDHLSIFVDNNRHLLNNLTCFLKRLVLEYLFDENSHLRFGQELIIVFIKPIEQLVKFAGIVVSSSPFVNY